jgi:hypothetical protein
VTDLFPDVPSSAEVDAAIDRALRGEAVGDDFTPLGQFVDDIRAMVGGPPPQPSEELAELVEGGIADAPTPATTASPEPGARRAGRARWSRRSARRSHATPSRVRIAALGVAGKATLGLAFTTAVAAGGAAGILPEPAGHLVRRAIEAVTPFDLPDQGPARHVRDHRGGDSDDHRSAYEPNDAAVAPPGSQPGVTGGEPGPGEMLSSDHGLPTGADTAPDMYPAVDPSIDADASGWAQSSPRLTAPTSGTAGSTPPPASDSATGASPNGGSATNGRPPDEHTPPGGPPPDQPKPSGPPTGQPHSGGPPPDQPKPSGPPTGQPHSGGPPPDQPKPSDAPQGQTDSNEPPAGQPKPSEPAVAQPKPNDPPTGQSHSGGPPPGQPKPSEPVATAGL